MVAIGWGQKSARDSQQSEELQQVTLQTISYESDSCQMLITSKEEQFCAGVETGGKGKHMELLPKKL